MVNTVSFMLCIFHHNKKERERKKEREKERVEEGGREGEEGKERNVWLNPLRCSQITEE